MKVLITGGTGFLGSNLALHYANAGHQVMVLSKEATDAERANALDLEQAGVQVIRGDVRDNQLTIDCCENADVVHHIAATMREANVSDKEFREVNVTATQRILQVARDVGVKRFVYCSSIGAMGKSPQKPASEESRGNPQDIYQVTKKEAEDLCVDFCRVYGFPVSIVRPADVYGPRDRRLLKLFGSIKKRRFAMIGSGRNEHHMVYIDDMIAGFSLAAEVEAAIGQVFIIAGEHPVKLDTLVAVIAGQLGVPTPRLRIPLFPVRALAFAVETACRPFSVQPPIYQRRVDFFRSDYAFDISKARRVLGYQPRHGLELGISKTLHWYEQAGLL